VFSTVKFEANIEAVSLWQSKQLQMKVSTRPGPWVGWGIGSHVSEQFEEAMELLEVELMAF
jgi:hypothetical protein